MTKAPPPIAFIGLGIMGAPMAGHLLAAGHSLHVFNRSPDKAAPLVARGASAHASAGEAAAKAGIIITMVGYPKDVEEVYFGPGGIVERAPPGALLIDMTTSSPSLAVRIHAAAAARGLMALDAPVSGGDVGAREARLSIMAGGEAEAFAAALPILQRMGTNVVHVGGPGAGQHTKLVNQIVIAGTMLGVTEGLAYAGAAGLDAAKVLSAIGAGAAGSFLLNVLGPRMLNEDWAAGFFVEHFIKDMGLAHDEAAALGLCLPGLETARAGYGELAANGGARDGTQALFKNYRR